MQAAICEAVCSRRNEKQNKWSILSEHTLKHLHTRLIYTISHSRKHLRALEPVLTPLKEENDLDKGD